MIIEGYAPEEDFEGTRPDDWAESDRLAAEFACDFRRWRRPYPGRDLGPSGDSFRNAAERAHNLRRIAAIATLWAQALEAGDPLEPGTVAYDLATRNNEANVVLPECPTCGAPPGQAHDPTCPPGPEVDDEGGMSEFRRWFNEEAGFFGG